jgi:AraC-like DNA-binding protein
MAVPAHLVTDLIFSADREMVDMRAGAAVRAGTFSFEGHDLVTNWHCHDLHQIEYALEGVAEVETAHGHYLLPPQQAVWIPAGLLHQTTLRRVRSVSVFFAADMLPGFGERARVLAAAPVIREMIIYGVRWPITRGYSDKTSDAFFNVLAQLIADWLGHEAPLCLSTSTDPLVAAAMAYTREHLTTVTEAEVCAAVSVSQRTLRRRFAEDADMTWRRYLLESRILRAMAQLAESTESVTAISFGVGFTNISSFSRSFRQYVGETPSAYRARVRQP